MSNCSSAPGFTPLIESTSTVTATPPPAPFDPKMAYLLGQCCSLTYAQFDAGLNWVPDFSSLTLTGYSISATNPVPFSVYESNGPAATTGDVGNYYQVAAGFGVQLTLSPGSGSPETIIVIALRGTQTWTEWFDDADVFPVPFGATGPLSDGLGSVHSGFYGLYTNGVDGKVSSTPLSSTPSDRASGSIAFQVAEYVTGLTGNLPIYVTGHSLGAALASFCALDIASVFPNSFSSIYMYNLASPRVAVGLSVAGITVPTLGNQQGFIASVQNYVPNSYRIVNAADIVPILPTSSIGLGPALVTCAHITDPYSIGGSGATATASISGGAVTSVNVDNSNTSGYYFAPRITFSGGGGTGASASASLYSCGFYNCVSAKVTGGGSGYSTAPNVSLPTSGDLEQNVVTFCSQTGDIGCNPLLCQHVRPVSCATCGWVRLGLPTLL